MAQNVTVQYGSRNATLFAGWMPQPNGRGTIDILWSCAFTIFLSSWSVLCLNLPAADEGWWKRAQRKFYWMLLAIMGPEIIFQLALGEWILARKWVRAFKDAGFEDWTMTHSFYANMGGFRLKTPDQGTFPVNAAQLHNLLSKGYIAYPFIERNKIQDKNKAEAIVRCLTLGQIIWFFVSCMARLHQGLALTSIELSTLAFTFSAVGSFYCWYHKPMDVEVPDILEITASIESIQKDALGMTDDTWHRTPLDFVDRVPEWPWNIYWQCGMRLLRHCSDFAGIPGAVLRQRHRPAERFPDDYWPAPTFRSLPALFVFHVGYAAILMAGWKLKLPTYTELLLWRIATTIQLGTIATGCLTMPIMMADAPERLQRLFSFVNRGREKLKQKAETHIHQHQHHHNHQSQQHDQHEQQQKQQQKYRPDLKNPQKWYSSTSTSVLDRVESTRSMIGNDPNWRVSIRLLVVYQVTWLIYFTSRMYIVVEDVVSMRAMPVTAFESVDWSEYFPHV